MANAKQLKIIDKGVEFWNKWREKHPTETIDLSGHDFSKAYLRCVNLKGADLSKAILWKADLAEAHLERAILTGANLRKANFFEAHLENAKMQHANLTGTLFVGTWLNGADLTGSFVYGCSVWDADLSGATQKDLVLVNMTKEEWMAPDRHKVSTTVDDLLAAQFIYLLMRNENIRHIIDATTSKVVLLLGRFTDKRKHVLDSLREELRTKYNFTPILFDFDPASNQDISDTVTLLARMARFMIADLTDARSVQQELTLIAPAVMVAIRPIILKGQEPWALFDNLRRRSPGLLPIYEYRDLDDLLTGLQHNVISPAEAKRLDLLPQHV